jgi:hypothetical protein
MTRFGVDRSSLSRYGARPRRPYYELGERLADLGRPFERAHVTRLGQHYQALEPRQVLRDPPRM